MGMFLRRGLPSKFMVILSVPVSYSSTYSMYAVVNGEKLTDAATIEFYSGSEVRVTISYSALRSNSKVILNGVTVADERSGTYEFVATKNTEILFSQSKKYNGDGNTVWTPTCTITEN
jgi:hypothetical protein